MVFLFISNGVKNHFMQKLSPKCYGKNAQTFIEVNGFVSPCCWLVSTNKRADLLKKLLGNKFDKLYITESSMDEIKQIYKKLENTWKTDQPFSTCLEECRNNKNV